MYRITIDILDPNGLGAFAAKETIAMVLEQFGPVRVVRVQDSEERVKSGAAQVSPPTEQLRL